MKIQITQKKISRLILYILVAFLLLFFVSISSNLFPPLIWSAQVIKQDNAKDRILLKGRFPSRQDYSAKIIVNTKTINNSSIISWSRRKIIYEDSPPYNDIEIIQIRANEKSSNKKILLHKQKLNEKSLLSKGESYYAEDLQFPEIISKLDTSFVPFQPILFKYESDTATPHIFSMSTSKSVHEIIPNYNIFFDGSVLQIFLDESLWFNQEDSVTLYIIDSKDDTQHTITAKELFKNNAYHTISYQLSLYYPKTNVNNLVFVPLSTTYQHSTILDKDLQTTHIKSSPFIHLYGDEKSFVVQSQVIQGARTLTKFTPVFYNNELPLSYLYDHALPQDIALLNNLLSNYEELIHNINVVNMQLPPSFNTAAIKNHFLLDPQQIEPNNPVDFDLLNIFLQLYIMKVAQRIETLDNKSLNDLSMVSNLAKSKSIDIDNIDGIQKNLATALFLRTQGFVARTIIGFDTTNIPPNTKESTNYINKLVSWVEVLTKDFAWISMDNNHFYERKDNEVSLFVAEDFAHKIANAQNPYFPFIQSTSIISK